MAENAGEGHDAALGEPSRNGYMRGCRCVACKKAQAEYRAGRRKAKNTEVGKAVLAAVPDVPVQPVHGAAAGVSGEEIANALFGGPPGDVQPGPVASVQDETAREIALLAGAEFRPGLVATAMRMARLLDNPEAVTQWPSAAARLADLLEQLGRGGRKKVGRLAAVRDMTGTA